ncbi:metallophosphoesterase [Georgenia halophila]|uniref:metallophosphoesterase n=1 Tax=Georgenia halophila TaxID=620889 RepID=UPI0031EDE92C
MSEKHRTRKVLSRSVGVLALIGLLLAVYGTAVEPRFILDERRYQAEIPGLGAGWDGAELAVFSDLQVGMWWDNTAMVERVVDRVVEEEPAAALIAGDFLYSTSPSIPQQVQTVMGLLEPLRAAGIPTFVVLGNHDHAVEAAEELTAAFDEAGIVVLENEATEIPAPDGQSAETEPLYAVGLAATRPGRTDAAAALSGVPADAPRVVMMHNPTAFARLPAHSAPLAVAGHTHCGQIVLPGAPRWSYVGLTEDEEVVADGFAPPGHGAEGNSMFVTCGIGFSLLPVRINAPPQLVFFELVPG